jgi:hypothetical protein
LKLEDPLLEETGWEWHHADTHINYRILKTTVYTELEWSPSRLLYISEPVVSMPQWPLDDHAERSGFLDLAEDWLVTGCAAQ